MEKKEVVKDIIDVVEEPLISSLTSFIFDGAASVAGTVVPGVSGLVFAYKQKRSEKMMLKFINQIKDRISDIEEKLLKLTPDNINLLKEKYYGLILDYVVDNKQEEKIKYIVNGFETTISEKLINEDIMLVYYDTLNKINLIDLKILILYSNNFSIDEIRERMDVDYEEIQIIMEKLIREGLIKREVSEELEKLTERALYGSGNFEYNNPIRRVLEECTRGRGGYILTSHGKKFLEYFRCNQVELECNSRVN